MNPTTQNTQTRTVDTSHLLSGRVNHEREPLPMDLLHLFKPPRTTPRVTYTPPLKQRLYKYALILLIALSFIACLSTNLPLGG